MKKMILITGLSIVMSGSLQAQSNAAGASSMSWSMNGQVMAATDFDAAYLNLGGPSLRYGNKQMAVSVAMLPSLRFREDKSKPYVTPLLGSGLLFQYKKLMVGLLFYYIAGENKWKPAAGAGIRL